MLIKNAIPIIFSFLTAALNAQVYDTAHVTIPGTLDSVAKAYLTTVTNLTVTGNIDARDFKTMRDSMPSLAVINLIGTTIISYTGTYGTEDANNDIYPANAIPQYAFFNQLTYIGKTSLTSITFPVNISFIGNYAFAGLNGLTGSLNLSSSIDSIGEFAFSGCSGLTGSLTIPSSVTHIGGYSFNGCSGCKDSLTIGTSVTYIGDEAFRGCGFTGSLTIPSSVTYIGNEAFTSPGLTDFIVEESNPFYSSINGVIFNKNKTTIIECPQGKTGTYSIPSNVESVGDYAFSGCSGLTGSLTIPSTITYLGDYSFIGCSGFKDSLYIGSSVTYIGNDAFGGCGFTGTLTIGSSVSIIGSWAFNGCSFTGLLNIPSSVTNIGNYAFMACGRFTGPLSIPSSVTSIGDYAFNGCYGFTGTLTIPPSVTSIGSRAFSFCNNLRSIIALNPVPLSESAMGESVFLFAGNIPNLYVPYGSVMAYKALPWWSSINILPVIQIYCSTDTLHTGNFVTFSADTGLIGKSLPLQWQVNGNPTGTGDSLIGYKPENGDIITCNVTINGYVVPSNAIVINFSGFTCSNNMSITVATPGTLNTLIHSCLSTTSNLTVTGTIDARDFKTMRDSMPSLTVINLKGATITAYTGKYGTQDANMDTYPANAIPQYAFYNQHTEIPKTSLTSITYPTNVNSIGDYAFSNCSGLTGSLIIPSSVTYIGDGAFTDCWGFTGSLTIPSSITYIEPETFANSGFTGTLTIPSSVTHIGGGAFFDCPGLTGPLIIPSSVTSIDQDAFYGCEFTGSLTIPSSITYIGDYAFFSSEFNSIVDLNPTPLTGNIDSSAFYEDAIKNLYVPYNSISLYKATPPWNKFNILPIVQITANSDTVYPGSSITIKAEKVSPGQPVILQWLVNGKKVGLDSTILSYVPLNGDSISCRAIFDNDTVISNSIVMKVLAATLSVSANTLNVPDISNSKATFTIWSNVSWTINEKQNWVTPDVNYGSDTADIILTASSNPLGQPRTDTLVVSATGADPQTIIVIQEANPKTNVLTIDNQDVKLYPVPVTKLLNVYLPFTPDNTEILIYKADGEEVYSSDLTDGVTAIDMGNFSAGIYFIKIYTPDKGMVIRKILKL